MNGDDALIAKVLMGKRKKEEFGDFHGKKKDCKDSYSEAMANKSSLDAPKRR